MITNYGYLALMKYFYLIVWNLVIALGVQAQEASYALEIKRFHDKENADFLDPNKSPLSKEDREAFKGHDFFPIDPDYRVVADFIATPDSKPFPLATSKGTTRLYKKLGDLKFILKGEKLSLEVYREVKRFTLPGEKVYLFLPIIDKTTGDSTYGAGRYMHYEGIPEGNKWVIDFNKAYNPYCAYSDRYECPAVPKANHLSIAIEAGVKGY